MKQTDPVNQNTERGRIPDIRQNTPERGNRAISGGALLAIILTIFAVSCLSAQRGGAQSEPAQIVTPYPGPVLTLTAASVNAEQARSDKARADEAKRNADAQARQANDAINSAAAAQQAAQNALQAQQVQAASDLLSQMGVKLDSARNLLDQLTQTVNAHQAIVDSQSDKVISLTLRVQQLESDNQQLRTDKNTILANFTAIQNQLTELSQRPNGLSISPGLMIAALGLIAIIVGVIVFAVSRNHGDPPKPVDTSQIDRDEAIEGEVTHYDQD